MAVWPLGPYGPWYLALWPLGALAVRGPYYDLLPTVLCRLSSRPVLCSDCQKLNTLYREWILCAVLAIVVVSLVIDQLPTITLNSRHLHLIS